MLIEEKSSKIEDMGLTFGELTDRLSRGKYGIGKESKRDHGKSSVMYDSSFLILGCIQSYDCVCNCYKTIKIRK